MFLPALRSAFISARLAGVGEDFKRRWNRRFSKASGSRRESKDRASSKIDSLNEKRPANAFIDGIFILLTLLFLSRGRARMIARSKHRIIRIRITRRSHVKHKSATRRRASIAVN